MNKEYYFKLSLKRAFKIFPVILVISFVIIVSIALTLTFVLTENNRSEEKQKITVGLVGDIDEVYFNGILDAVKEIDSSRFFIEFTEMTEDEAITALKNREINGYAMIPEDFVQGIYYGYNTPAKYFVLDGPDVLESVLTTEVTQVLSNLVLETQSGVFSMQKVAEKHGKTENLDNDIIEFNLKYINNVISRDGIYKLNVLGISDSLSIGGYYICAMIIFFLLLWGISCNKLLESDNVELFRMLNAYGMKPHYQLLCEYSAFLIVTLIMLQIFAVSFGVLVFNNSFGIEELKAADITSCIMFVFKMFPVVVMFTTMHKAFYELVAGQVSRILLQFIIAISLAYISGCFYPSYFFPETVRKVAEFLPAGTGFSYLKKLISETVTLKELLLSVLYTLIFACLTLMARKRRMAGVK